MTHNKFIPKRERERRENRERTIVSSGYVVPKSCGKTRYRSEVAARRALESVAADRDNGSGKKPKRAYECPDCLGWHLTSKASPRDLPPTLLDRLAAEVDWDAINESEKQRDA